MNLPDSIGIHDLREQPRKKPASPALKRAPVPVLSAFFMIYIFVSGGSFGIEEMVSSSGPGLTILLLVLLPIFWALPMALIASELGSAIPAEGGFYVWARRALGDFWGFQTAWWWSLSILVDTSLYVVLSVGYLQNQLGFDQFTFYLVCWTIIGVFALVNIAGVQLVAIGSTLLSILILAPFVVLTIIGIANWQFNPLTPVTPPDVDLFGSEGALALGLAVGLWMYSGYESMSTLAGEIRNPQKVIPRALMLALPFVAIMYLMPTVASLAAFGNWEQFAVTGGDGDVSFVEIAAALGGTALGHAMLAAAVLGNLALYLDYLASGARPFYALATDGLLPAPIARVSKRFGTPVAAILLVALVNAVLVIGPFQSLVVIDVMLLICSYTVIFVSAVRLRFREPGLDRPFRIPLGTTGMIAMVTPPVALVVLTLYLTAIDRSVVLLGSDGFSVLGMEIGWYGIAGFVALLSGPLLYPFMKNRYGGPEPLPGQDKMDQHNGR